MMAYVHLKYFIVRPKHYKVDMITALEISRAVTKLCFDD